MTSQTSAGPTIAAMKPLRFITNDGQPYAKRRRVNAACNTCRRRKTRCSGEKPFCETCKSHNQLCAGYGDRDEAGPVTAYNQSARKEGPRAEEPESSASCSDAASQPRLSRPPTLDQIVPESSSEGDPWQAPKPARDSVDGGSDVPASNIASLSIRNRMPYFRYFGPTAIMPGFKQMVVKVNDKARGTTTTSSGLEAWTSPRTRVDSMSQPLESPNQEDLLSNAAPEPPIYDTSDMPPNPLIVHLCETFFKHLGCSYPFLQKQRFMRDLEGKHVDPILVDAVCALAARFSDHPLLTGKAADPPAAAREIPRPERGQLFAARAKQAIPDAFTCPNVAVVQAALLLAYDEFGANRDSGLWMYLGIAIRMAQDLGMQKLEGLRYIGRDGPTPRTSRFTREKVEKTTEPEMAPPRPSEQDHTTDKEVDEIKAVEQERVDTFWAIFHLDRYISSGTGRPVALCDEDIEVAFPPLDQICPSDGWPRPWPALIRIVHLYGKVSNILNGIKELVHMTPEVMEQLTIMESNLTDIYQGLPQQLHFNAINFQHYVQVGEGTNFVMLHFWFHTLIVLLHQPTLLHTFDRGLQELFPKSRELSMSSAKTIADILAFTELMSAKSALGNPFTSQPTYIAACAFLKESARQARTSTVSSRASSPSFATGGTSKSAKTFGNLAKMASSPRVSQKVSSRDEDASHRHTLLVSASQQNYQRCYRALQNLEEYWAGTKYILTVLEQKSRGVWDALLYTREEVESSLEMPKPEPAFTSPGWRRKLSWGSYLGAKGSDTNSQAIGFSLTGTMNFPKTASLAVLYPSPSSPRKETDLIPAKDPFSITSHTSLHPLNGMTIGPPYVSSKSKISQTAVAQANTARHSDADLLLNLNSPYSRSSRGDCRRYTNIPFVTSTAQSQPLYETTRYGSHTVGAFDQSSSSCNGHGMGVAELASMPYGNMMIESQDIDMSMLEGDDLAWLEYLPTDVVGGFDPGGHGGGQEDGSAALQ